MHDPFLLPSFCAGDSSEDAPVTFHSHLEFAVHDTPLRFRSLGRHDLLPLRRLQEELFPVRYSDDFYASLVRSGVLSILAFLPSPSGAQPPPLVALAIANHRTHRASCSPTSTKSAYLITLGVHGAYRGLGLGSFMLHAMAALLREHKCSAVALHVMEANEEAVRMYLRAGWEVRDRLAAHYLIDGAHHAALLMGRRLSADDDDADDARKAMNTESSAYWDVLTSKARGWWSCALQ